jgi:hypothetical protein
MSSRSVLSIAILFAWSATLQSDEVALEEFTSKEGKFSILMPKEPNTGSLNVDSPLGKLKMTLTEKEEGGLHYAVVFADYPADKIKGFDVDKSLDGARDGSVKNSGGKLIQEKKITLGKGKYPGRELLIQLKDEKLWMRQRIYMVGLRQYQVVLAGPEKRVKGKFADRFFQSFKLKE